MSSNSHSTYLSPDFITTSSSLTFSFWQNPLKKEIGWQPLPACISISLTGFSHITPPPATLVVSVSTLHSKEAHGDKHHKFLLASMRIGLKS